MPSTSFRPDVFSLDPPALIGLRCHRCGRTSFPARDACPGCGSLDDLEATPLETTASLCSWTVVRNAPEDLQTPYVLGYVDLPVSKVRVLGRLVATTAEDLRVGAPFELAAVPVAETKNQPDPTEATLFAFRPGTTQEEVR